MRKFFLILTIFCASAGVVFADAVEHVVISEIQTDSIDGTGGTTDDFVELFNPTDSAIDLSEYSIQKMNAEGGSFYRKQLSGEISAHGFFLIVRNHADTDPALLAAADVFAAGSSFSLSDNNSVFLVANNENIENSADPDIVDFVGFGLVPNSENFPMINPPEGQSLARKFSAENEIVDTDDNSADFEISADPTPQNSAADPVEPGDPDPPVNSAPAIPTEFSPTGATNSAELSALFSDPDGDSGTLEFLFFAAEPTECSNSDENFLESGSSNSAASGARGEWSPTGEISDGEYFWCARAIDGELFSEFSAVQNFALDTIPPAEVSAVAATGGTAAISGEFTAPDDADFSGVKIYLDDIFQFSLDSATTNFTISGLENDREYSVRVATFDSAGNESAGVTATATTAAIFEIAEPGEIIFSEIGWAGSTASSADEWLELENVSAKIFDISGWTITSAATSGTDFAISAGTLAPGEFFLVANYSEPDSALALAPDFADTSLSLSNSALEISLRDFAGNLVDSAGDGGAPPAGASGDAPASMLRIPNSENWRTATDSENFDDAANLGNPGAKNFRDDDLAISAISATPAAPLPGESVEFSATIENRGTNSAADFAIIWSVDGVEISRESISALASFDSVEKTFSREFDAGEFEISATIEFPADENSENNSASTNLSVAEHLVISEFVANPDGADSENEWIEIFNPTDAAISLAGFEINSTAISGEISAGGFFVLDNFTGLVNSADTVELFDDSGALVDSKNYENAAEGRSLGRDSENLPEWHEFHHPTKNSANILPENNSDPTAVITIQGSGNSTGNCLLFVNLTAENSSDPDDDELFFEWDFGNSETSDESNPGGFYFSPGEYSVELTATDALGATATATQIFTVGACSSGGGESEKIESAESEIESVPAGRVELKITEVSFNSAADWVEIFVANDGNSGNGIGLGGFYFESDKNVKTIPLGTKLKTGEYLVLEFKSETPDAVEKFPGGTKIFSERAGLTATDEQITIRDSTGAIEDAVGWENRDGKWSRGEDADIAEIVAGGGWNSAELDDSLDSSDIAREVVLAREFDSDSEKYFDTDSAADWFATPLSTPGEKNSPRTVRADEFDFQFSAISPRNPGGDSVAISCPDCAEKVSLAGFALRNGLDEVIFEFPPDSEISAAAPVEIIFSAESDDSAENIFRTTARGLAGSDDFVSLRDSANSVADFVGWSDRAVPPIRAEFDISLPQKNQLEKRFADGDWISDAADSLLDSSALPLGGSFVRQNSADSNSAADFSISPPEIPLDEIATGSGNIVISEIFANPVGTDSGNEWFELANRGDEPVELFGWSVGVASSFAEFENSEIIAPGEFRAFRGMLPIRNSAATIFVLDPDGEIVDSVEYPDAEEGVAFARNSRDEFAATEIPTPDAPNGFFQLLDPDDDTDGDGLENSAENEFGTDPENFDTDGDGLPDFFEIQNDSDPLVADSTPEKLRKYREELSALGGSRFQNSLDDGGVFLAGVGVPGGRVRIFIQSELQIVEVPVDENGKWNYSLDRKLESGAHHIFAQLIDPAGVEGVAKKVLEFSLAENFTPPTFPESVRISEILPDPDGADAENEFVEIENFGSESADISNFTLSVGRKKFALPENSVVAAGEFLVVPRVDSALVLANSGGKISLVLPTGRVLDSVEFPELKSGTAFAFSESEFRATENPTPGAANSIFISPEKSSSKSSTPQFANGNLSDAIRISEIFANPAGDDAAGEFVELENFGSAPVNLGNWTISDNQKTVALSDSITLRPGEFVALPRATTKIALNNSGREKIALADFRGKIVDEFEFESPAEGVVLALDSAEFRESKIPTPGSANEFDTAKISGTVKFRGDEGFVVATAAGEIFVRFGESNSALLARALFRDGGQYEIFTTNENGEFTLAGFRSAPNFLAADLLALDSPDSATKNSSWIFTLVIFAVIFAALRFAVIISPAKKV